MRADGGRVSFQFYRGALRLAFVPAARVTAPAFLEADARGSERERVGNRRSWMIAAWRGAPPPPLVRARRRRRCREIRTFQPDTGWHYPAGGAGRGGGEGETASPPAIVGFARFSDRAPPPSPPPPSKALENGRDNSRAENETLWPLLTAPLRFCYPPAGVNTPDNDATALHTELIFMTGR